MAVIIDNRSDISGLSAESFKEGAQRIIDQGKSLIGMGKKKPAAPAQASPVPDAGVTLVQNITPELTGVEKAKAKAKELWAKPAVKAGVGVAGLLAAVLAYKKWKK